MVSVGDYLLDWQNSESLKSRQRTEDSPSPPVQQSVGKADGLLRHYLIYLAVRHD